MSDERAFLPALRFRALTPLFDRVVRATTRELRFKQELMERASLRDGHTALDVGCGTGTLAIMIKRSHPGCRVTGLDADPDIIEIASRKAAEAQAEVKFDQALANALPYEDGSFDHVFSSLFFHHLTPADKRETLAELRRVLRPGGQLHIADFTAPSGPVQWVLSRQILLFDGPTRTRENLLGALPDLLSEAGFRGVRTMTRMRTPLGTIGLIIGDR